MNNNLTVLHNVSLLPYNTFGINVSTEQLVEVKPSGSGSPASRYAHAIEELYEGRMFDRPYLVLGAGSNIVFTKDYHGTVILMSKGWVNASPLGEEATLVSADAGMLLDDVIQWSIEHDLYGIENLSAIPGTVGASVVQNVGAYGVEAKDVVYCVDAYDLKQKEFVTLKAEECCFGYRDSIFKHNPGRYIVINVSYRLFHTFRPNLAYQAITSLPHSSAIELRNAIIDLRWNKLPRPEVYGSAGSFFKNPIVDDATYNALLDRYPDMPRYPGNKLSAGWLIDKCGWKGRSVGRVGVWPKQALVLYNLGGCTGAEVFELSNAIASDVKTKFDVALQCEAIFVD